MGRTPSAAELTRETRGWLKRGVIPAEAAAARRKYAEMLPTLADWHNAFADQWDAIAARYPSKVIEAYVQKLNYETGCLALQEPGSELAKYWQDRAAETDREIARLREVHGIY